MAFCYGTPGKLTQVLIPPQLQVAHVWVENGFPICPQIEVMTEKAKWEARDG